ncbi:MAG: hypothetical protein H6729_06240 [Deltaproteobacteria bacterium]|nr:hypothetical protein [Deltaproteobacteria bacterium]
MKDRGGSLPTGDEKRRGDRRLPQRFVNQVTSRLSNVAFMFFMVGCTSAFLSACGDDALVLRSLLDDSVAIEVQALKVGSRAACDQPLNERACQGDYEFVGLVEMGPHQERSLTLSDGEAQDECGRLLWLRLVRFKAGGPVSDPGTVLLLPAEVEVEMGAGALHSVAFAEGTVRIDEVGTLDAHQSGPPVVCTDAD